LGANVKYFFNLRIIDRRKNSCYTRFFVHKLFVASPTGKEHAGKNLLSAARIIVFPRRGKTSRREKLLCKALHNAFSSAERERGD
jgi:hypothetical protein